MANVINRHNFIRFSQSGASETMPKFPTPYRMLMSDYLPYITSGESLIEYVNSTNDFADDGATQFSDINMKMWYPSAQNSFLATIGLTQTIVRSDMGIDYYRFYYDIEPDSDQNPGEVQIGFGFDNQLVLNPEFSSASNWTLTGGAAISGGELIFSGTGSAQSDNFTIFFTPQVLEYNHVQGGSTGTLKIFTSLDVEVFNQNLGTPSATDDYSLYLNLDPGDYYILIEFTTYVSDEELDYVRLFDFEYTSNCLFFTEDSSKLELTSILQYRNEYTIYYYPYDQAAANYFNQIRLQFYQRDIQYPFEVEQYKESTTGVSRNYNSNAGREYIFETYFFDDDSHESMGAVINHSSFILDDRSFTVKEGYQIETLLRSAVSKGVLTLIDQDYAQLNLNGEQVS